jgi:hypothetical protein
VAKYAHKANRAAVFRDRKKAERNARRQKHPTSHHSTSEE